MRLSALIFAAALAALSAPAFAQGVPPATGGATALPVFDLTAELAPLPAQLSAHQARLAETETAAGGNDPVVAVIVGQLRTRIRLLDLFIAPQPAFDPEAAPAGLQQQLTENQAALDRFRGALDEAKGAMLGARDVGAIDARVNELTERVARLTALLAGPPAPPAPPPANPPAEPAPPAAPAEPAPPAPPAEPLRLTMGDLMSSIARMSAEIDALRALPRPLRPEAIRIVSVTELVGGQNGQAVQQAMNRAFFRDLHAYLSAEPPLRDALAAAGVAIDRTLAVKVLADGTIAIFVG